MKCKLGDRTVLDVELLGEATLPNFLAVRTSTGKLLRIHKDQLIYDGRTTTGPKCCGAREDDRRTDKGSV